MNRHFFAYGILSSVLMNTVVAFVAQAQVEECSKEVFYASGSGIGKKAQMDPIPPPPLPSPKKVPPPGLPWQYSSDDAKAIAHERALAAACQDARYSCTLRGGVPGDDCIETGSSSSYVGSEGPGRIWTVTVHAAIDCYLYSCNPASLDR